MAEEMKEWAVRYRSVKYGWTDKIVVSAMNESEARVLAKYRVDIGTGGEFEVIGLEVIGLEVR